MRVLEVGKTCYETQGSGPRVNEMRHGVVWLERLVKCHELRRTEAYALCSLVCICEMAMQLK